MRKMEAASGTLRTMYLDAGGEGRGETPPQDCPDLRARGHLTRSKARRTISFVEVDMRDMGVIWVPKKLRQELRIRAAMRGVPMYRLIEELLELAPRADQAQVETREE